jgi:hypothetical protein
MISHHVFYQLTLIVLVWLFLMLHWLWRSAPASTRLTTAQPIPTPRKRSKGPKPFQGLTRKPHCDACEQDVNLRREPPCALPPRLVSLRGRRRQVDTSHHFCPNPHCRYSGWTGLGNISANGHPSGGPWRQLHCSRCGGYFLETHGTPFRGKRVSPEKLVWAIAALAEGLGIRAVARVFEVDPNTALLWLVEAAEHLKALLRHFLYDVHVDQVQMDELFALLRRSCTSSLRVIPSAQKPRKMPSFHHRMRAFCHGITFFSTNWSCSLCSGWLPRSNREISHSIAFSGDILSASGMS